MSGTQLYILLAGVVIVIAVAVLITTTMMQIRKQGQKVEQKEDRAKSKPDGEASSGQSKPLVEKPIAEEPELVIDVEPMDSGMGVAPMYVETDPAAPDRVRVTPMELPVEHAPPLVMDAQEAEEALSGLDEDAIVRLSAFAAVAEPEDMEDLVAEDHREDPDDEPVTQTGADMVAQENTTIIADDETFSAWLTDRLSHHSVLGWLTVYADGRVGVSDQTYDQDVVTEFSALAEQARRTAELVGLSHAQEFVVRGVEGIIYLTPADRVYAGRPDYLVVFLDGEVMPIDEVREMLGHGSMEAGA